MKGLKLSKKAKDALTLGTLCCVAYLAVYVARNVLSTVSPQMTKEGIFDKEFVGTLSSVFFIAYAVGQLINGFIGDHIKARYMMSFGLLLSGITNYAFSFVTATPTVSCVVYALCGFFLSMIYAPMTKVVADSMEPIHAVRCGISHTFAMFFGSPLAGLLAAFFVWRSVFAVSSAVLVIMAVLCFVLFAAFEKKGILKHVHIEPAKKGSGNIKLLIKRQIVKFSFVAMITGIIRTTVIFWLPTYIEEYLEFPEKDALFIFSAATMILSASAFVSLFVFEKFNRDINKSVLFFFSVSSCMFALVYLVNQPILNVIFIVLAIMASHGAASILWSMYCPSLKNTGMVSGATGFLDFISYISAAVSSTIFANAVDSIGWGNLILVWFGLLVFGVIIALPYDRFRKNNSI